MTAETARRHHKPRYRPAAPRRALPIDPARAEKPHPRWCNCGCQGRHPSDRGRLGCNALCVLALAGLGVGAAASGALPLGGVGPTIATVLIAGIAPIGAALTLFGKHLS